MKTNVPVRFPSTRTAPLRLAGTLALLAGALCGQARQIDCGQTITDTLQSAGQTNTYEFPGNAGDSVTILALGQTVNPVVDIQGPSGSRVGGCTNQFSGPLRLPARGTYTIAVHAADPAATGTYGLSVSFLTGQCGTPLIWGPSVTNTVAALAEVDSYTFSGQAGESVVLNVTRSEGNLIPAAYIAGPDGTMIANWVNSSTASLDLTRSGAYTVGVYSFYYGGTGAYALSLFYARLTAGSYRLAIDTTNGAAGLSIWGEPGRTTLLECTTNLAATNAWLTLTNFNLPWSPYRFVDWDSANTPARFYRTEQ